MNQWHYIDTHSHLNDARFDADIVETLARMREAKVASIVVGTDHAMNERAVALAEKHNDLWATIGEHPTDHESEEFDDAHYAKLAAHPKVVAIGECGLDYFRLDQFSGNKDAEADRQRELFERQMHLALSVDKPLMIHGRPSKGTMDAYEDLLYILTNGHKKHGAKIRGNVHFFVGDTDIAKQFLDLGFTMSFTGVLTFTHDYDEVVKYIPLASLHAETDAPYVAPVPHRGTRNEPAYVIEAVHAIAKIKKIDEEKVREALIENARRTYSV